MSSVFEQIKSRLNLVEYIGKNVRLKHSAGKFLGLCPFHSEKTPSFYVDPSKNLYHCFGCQEGGDIFDFHMKFFKTDKKQALKDLAALAGVSLELGKKITKTRLDQVNDFFKVELDNMKEAKDFLKTRKITQESIKKFNLGYLDYANTMQFLSENKLDLEVFGFKENTWKMFAGRIIFPIYNRFGQVCSFAGRILPSASSSADYTRAKYLNGPASKYFHKSKILYGMNFTKKYEKLYIVEGYFDVIFMYQSKLQAVAPMGTSFTPDHLEVALSCSSDLVVAMDGDAAGRKSALKIAYKVFEMLQKGEWNQDNSIVFIEFPEGEDAASWLEKNTIGQLKEMQLDEYIFAAEYSNLINSGALKAHDGAKFFKKMMDMAGTIKDPVLKSEYRKRWRNFWWSKDKLKSLSSLAQQESAPQKLVLLLFKYVVLYPDILDEISEAFAKLPLNSILHQNSVQNIIEVEHYMQQFEKLLNNQQLDDWILEKIANTKFVDQVNSKEDAVNAWYQIANHLQDLVSDELSNRNTKLEKNFSEAEWEKYKKWIESKMNSKEV